MAVSNGTSIGKVLEGIGYLTGLSLVVLSRPWICSSLAFVVSFSIRWDVEVPTPVRTVLSMDAFFDGRMFSFADPACLEARVRLLSFCVASPG